jgi:hypothetical protein
MTADVIWVQLLRHALSCLHCGSIHNVLKWCAWVVMGRELRCPRAAAKPIEG